MSAVVVSPAGAADLPAFARIYNHYIAHTVATYQSEPTTAAAFAPLLKNGLPFLRATAGDEVCGYCYADVFKARHGYRHTKEVSIYVDHRHLGKGAGNALMAALLPALQQTQTRLAVAVISLPNAASVALHEKYGFVHCGSLRAAGKKFGKWLDSGYWTKDFGDKHIND